MRVFFSTVDHGNDDFPVFETEKPRRAAEPAAPVSAESASATTGGPVARGIAVTPTAAGFGIAYAANRCRGMALGLLVFGAIFLGFGTGIVSVAWRSFSGSGPLAFVVLPMLAVFLLVFGLVGFVLFAGGVYTLGHSMVTRFDATSVAIVQRWMGIVVDRSETRYDELDSIDVSIGSQSGQGGKSEITYRILGYGPEGQRVTLGTGIRGTPAAERLAELIAEVTGIRPEFRKRSRSLKELSSRRRAAEGTAASRRAA